MTNRNTKIIGTDIQLIGIYANIGIGIDADISVYTDIQICKDNCETFQATVNNKWIARTFDKAAYPTRSQSSEQSLSIFLCTLLNYY